MLYHAAPLPEPPRRRRLPRGSWRGAWPTCWRGPAEEKARSWCWATELLPRAAGASCTASCSRSGRRASLRRLRAALAGAGGASHALRAAERVSGRAAGRMSCRGRGGAALQPAHTPESPALAVGGRGHRALPAAGQAGRGQLLRDEMAGEGFFPSRPAPSCWPRSSATAAWPARVRRHRLQAGGGRGQPLVARGALDTVARGGHHRTSLWPWSLEDCGFAVACEARINLSAAACRGSAGTWSGGPGRVSSDLFCQCESSAPICHLLVRNSACISSASVSPRPTPQEWAVCPCGLVDGWPQERAAPVSQWSPQSWI